MLNTAISKLVGTMALVVTLCGNDAVGHDTWVETGSNWVRQGEYVYVDLRLGNHGNNHRDFKLASKVTLAPCSLSILDPNGDRHDLKSKIIDLGNAEKEGYWSARFVLEFPGLYQVQHQLKMLKGKMNVIKNSRTYFVVGSASEVASIAKPAVIGQPSSDQLDLLLETPVETLEQGKQIVLKLFLKGKPLSGARVSIIPRGVELTRESDPRYEFLTDTDGTARFIPEYGNLYLAVVHYVADDEKGEAYDRTHYGSTLVLAVPNRALASAVPR